VLGIGKLNMVTMIDNPYLNNCIYNQSF